MFRKISGIIIAVLLCINYANMVMASENPNNFELSIYKTEFKDLYEIDYHSSEDGKHRFSYEKDVKNGIRLVMFNGGFVKDPGTVIKDDVVYISLQKFVEMTGAEVTVNRGDFVSISIDYKGQTLFVKSYSSTEAVLNGNNISMPRRFEQVLDDYYIPLRFICEAFGGEVHYYSDYIYTFQHDDRDDVPQINIITISMDENGQEPYTIQEAESIIKKASMEKYNQVVNGLSERNITKYENEDIYDPNAIRYTGHDLDRYYVFELEGYESLPIFFNKYTGKIFSHKAGLPFILIDEGFININWLL